MYGICNVVGASIPRNTDSGTYIHVGPEIGVASTKAFTGQVTVLMLLALCVGQMRGTVDDATVERIVRELKNMPLYIKDVLGLADKIKNLSKIYTYARNFLYLGRGYNYPTALEGALKLKEISYIHAEGYPAAEMKRRTEQRCGRSNWETLLASMPSVFPLQPSCHVAYCSSDSWSPQSRSLLA